MGLFDKAKQKASEFASNNPDKVDEGIDKAGDVVDDKTGDKYSDQVDKAQDFASDKFGGQGDEGGDEQN